MKQEKLNINGMTCRGCEKTIREALYKVEGIKTVTVNFKTSTATITYDENIISISDIEREISKCGYSVKKNKGNIFSIFLTVAIIVIFLSSTNLFNSVPKIDENINYAMLFAIGLLTSVHCIFMCGGINLAATNNSYKNGLKYNLGRLISYTLIGGFVGLLGSVIAFNQLTKDLINVVVGALMFVMGLQMLRIITLPRIFKGRRFSSNKPFVIGLLNGFMPCGPLQAMQLYALSTGSFISGAFSMFLFASGTIPLMLGFSFLSSYLDSKKLVFLKKLGSIFILSFGLMMILRSVELPTIETSIPSNAVYAVDKGDYQEVNVRFKRGRYLPIVVEKNKKVIWNITMEIGDLNGCNDEIYIPEFELSKKLEIGLNTVEFTPTKTGEFKYTCWMNMLRSNIYVVDNL